MKIGIIDYGRGNLSSVLKAFQYLGFNAALCADAPLLSTFDKLVLPGVGAFGDGMQQLDRLGFKSKLVARVQSGVPLLGICLGLQLLCEESEETAGVKGLGLIKGIVRKIKTPYKIPHMGWNECAFSGQWNFDPKEQNGYYYFVHSYCADLKQEVEGIAYSGYGEKIIAGFNVNHIWAMQFHPEKSQDLGLNLIKKWALL